MRFGSVELGHRILQTEEPQEPENLNTQGPLLPISWARSGGADHGRMRSRPWSSQLHHDLQSPPPYLPFPGGSLLPLFHWAQVPKARPVPDTPPPPPHLRCPPRTLTGPWRPGVDPRTVPAALSHQAPGGGGSGHTGDLGPQLCSRGRYRRWEQVSPVCWAPTRPPPPWTGGQMGQWLAQGHPARSAAGALDRTLLLRGGAGRGGPRGGGATPRRQQWRPPGSTSTPRLGEGAG